MLILARLQSASSHIKKYVSLLYERCQALKLQEPKEQLLPQTKPDPEFQILYVINGRAYPYGKGRTKQEARERAAKLALREIKRKNIPNVFYGKTDSMFDRYSKIHLLEFKG